MAPLFPIPQLLAVLHRQTVGAEQTDVVVVSDGRLKPRVPVSVKGLAGIGLSQKARHPSWDDPALDRRGVVMVGVAEAVVGDDVEPVSGQDLLVRVVDAGAGVQAAVGEV